MVTFRSLRWRRCSAPRRRRSGRRSAAPPPQRRPPHRPRRLTVTGHGPFPYQVDGDYLGEADHLEFRYEPDSLKLFMP